MATKLFTPLTLGGKKNPIQLVHRVVMSPCTRLRASETGVQTPLAADYYGQRATPGGLLISEATNISATANGYFRAPGIFTKEQVEAWKPATEAVHKKDGKIFLQLWHCGRVNHSSNQPYGQPSVSSSAVGIPSDVGSFAVTPSGPVPYDTPRAITLEEIPAVLEDYHKATRYAIEAGFDGVELHGANGYFLEQFLCDSVNQRTDKYGGSIENRARIIFEALDAVTSAVPSSQVGIRLTPFGKSFGCQDSTPAETYGYVVNKLNAYDLAYLHVTEPRGIQGMSDKAPESETVTPVYRKMYNGVILSSSGYERANAIETVADGSADAIAFGRNFIANPDFVKRLEKDLPFNAPDYQKFFTANGDIAKAAEGYTDYPFAS